MPITPGELISVVIPTYNRAHTLLRAINSVLKQDYTNIEVIVVDDASTDNTTELLAGISDPRLRVLTHVKNKGVASATNTGVQAAKGFYIAFQDSDDEWLDRKLSQQVADFAASAEDCVCVYCIKIVYGRDSLHQRGDRRVACVPGPNEAKVTGWIDKLLQTRNIVSPQTALCSRAAYDEIGGFDERLRVDQDWDFFSRLSEIGSFSFVDVPLVNTYIQRNSISLFTRKAIFSQIIICNKMKRRGVPRVVLAEHWSRIGSYLGRQIGSPKRGSLLLRAALVEKPLDLRTWARLALVIMCIMRRNTISEER